MSSEINLEEVNDYLEQCGPDTRIYMGCDSQVFYQKGKRVAKYTTAIVVHVDGCRGGKLFYQKSIEPDYNTRSNPSVRLMNEVYKVSALYLSVVENCLYALDKEIEVHLDLNPEKDYKSSAVIREAIGYIQGTCQVTPKVKPEAFAASTVADAY